MLFTSKAAICLNCRVLRHVHVKGHSRNFCRHKPIFVFSQIATNPATITVANQSYHSLMQCLQLNNEQIEVILQDHQLQYDWHSDRMLPQLKLLSCHESQKRASSIKVRFNGLYRLVAKHKMTSDNWAGYGNTYASQNFVNYLMHGEHSQSAPF